MDIQSLFGSGISGERTVRALGIDLGTTNSTVAEAVYDPASGAVNARCLEVDQPTRMGRHTGILVPSAVAVSDGKVIIGQGAKERLAQAAEYKLDLYRDVFSECKNEIGTNRKYLRAPDGFRSPSEIGGKVVDYLYRAATDDVPVSPERVVVTVPASFQAAQRYDTLGAAQMAGLNVTGGGLLDEPVAAFLDYIFTYGVQFQDKLREPKKVVVFDFGGGTCDVAVIQVGKSRDGVQFDIQFLSVSRYHRLGGGDIDKAIIQEILIPQLIEQNGLTKFDLDFAEKKGYVFPALLGVAESLKISLCMETARLKKFGRYDSDNNIDVSSKYPGVWPVKTKEHDLTLQHPTLTAQEFEELLEPFVDPDIVCANENEYRMTCSIYAPLQDAMERGGTNVEDVDFCLMVGGSSLVPQVSDSVGAFFPRAEILTFPDAEAVQTAVARGAAYHALALAMTGKGLVQAVAHDRICIQTASGPLELVPKGSVLPFPQDRVFGVSNDLTIPETVQYGQLDLRVELLAGDENRVVFRSVWGIPAPVKRGTKLQLEYRYDENQVLNLNLAHPESGSYEDWRLENPLTNIVNPNSRLLRIAQMEEDLKSGVIPFDRIPDKMVEVACEYADLGQREKSYALLKSALQRKNCPDPWIINRMGIMCGEMGDYDREEKLYRQAAEETTSSIPLFNLAVAQRSRRSYEESIETLDKALKKERIGPSLVLRAILADLVGDEAGRKEYLEDALAEFGPPATLENWAISWLITGARMAGNDKLLSEAEKELRDRRRINGARVEIGGQLPALGPEAGGGKE